MIIQGHINIRVFFKVTWSLLYFQFYPERDFINWRRGSQREEQSNIKRIKSVYLQELRVCFMITEF